MGDNACVVFKRLKIISAGLIFVLCVEWTCPPGTFAQTASVSAPAASSIFHPVLMRGLKIHPDDPLKFDFLIETGDSNLQGKALEQESRQLVRDFWTALAVPKQDLWVNLSPYEKDRMIPDALGQTRMGQDLLEQDYFLKQLTASLMKPDSESGRKFWDRVYEKIYQEHGVVDIPIETFHKVWIVPQTTSVYENPATGSVVVVKSELDVMLEEDYVAAQMSLRGAEGDEAIPAEIASQKTLAMTKDIIRQTILPLIKEEINNGEQFARLRQIVNAIMLAEWYKTRLTNSILNQTYTDQNKINGVASGDSKQNQKIFSDYLKLFSNSNEIISEQYDPVVQQIIPQKYVSGGFRVSDDNFAMLTPVAGIGSDVFHGSVHVVDGAMLLEGVTWNEIGFYALLISGIFFFLYNNTGDRSFLEKRTRELKSESRAIVRQGLEEDIEGERFRLNLFDKLKPIFFTVGAASLLTAVVSFLHMPYLLVLAIGVTFFVRYLNGLFNQKGHNSAMLALSFAPLLMASNMMLAIGVLWLWGISSVGFLILFWVFKYKSMPDEPPLGFKDNVKTDKAQLDSRFRGNDVGVLAPSTKGGIDLAQMNVGSAQSGEGIQMIFDPALLKKLQNATTFRPVVFGIHPADAGILQNSWGIAPAR